MSIPVKNFTNSRALEGILYVANRLPRPGYHNVCKMFYFADQLHLQRYGSMLSGDTYCAMENGPVPSRIYNMLKFAAGRFNEVPPESVNELRTFAPLEGTLTVRGYSVRANRDANLDYLSESQRECLDEAIRLHGHKTFGQLSDETHDAAWRSVDENQTIPLRAIVGLLPNAEEVDQQLAD
jgi:uncharacterized phage-associated protein